MLKTICLIIVSILVGTGVTIIVYENYLQAKDAYLDEVYSQLEQSSESAFNHLDPSASRFVQINNGLIIHKALKSGLIDEKEGNRLAAIFMTRACINYEYENKQELAEKMCSMASEDLSKWNNEIDFASFKKYLN